LADGTCRIRLRSGEIIESQDVWEITAAIAADSQKAIPAENEPPYLLSGEKREPIP